MGSHGTTCAVSLLPIQPGAAVRVMMLTKNAHASENGGACYHNDVWVPRAFPLKGKLGEFGEVREMETGIGPALWLEGLRMDAAGPAEISDDFSEVWSELHSGGIRVVRKARTPEDKESDAEYDESEWTVKRREEQAAKDLISGIPCSRNVQSLLSSIVGINAEHITVSERHYGDVRITVNGYGDDLVTPLQEILGSGVLDRFATVIAAGEQRGYGAELRVMPKPGTPDWHGVGRPLFEGGPLPVSVAYIREDIWQALIGTPISWAFGDTTTFEEVHNDVIAHCGFVQTALKQSRERFERQVTKYGAESLDAKWARRDMSVSSSSFNFLVKQLAEDASGLPEKDKWQAGHGHAWWYLTSGVGKAGATPAYFIGPDVHFALWCQRGLTGDEAAPWLRLFAEHIYIDLFMSAAHRLWAPSWHAGENAPVYPKFLRTCAKVYDEGIRADKRRYSSLGY